jgi:hypothetical protein
MAEHGTDLGYHILLNNVILAQKSLPPQGKRQIELHLNNVNMENGFLSRPWNSLVRSTEERQKKVLSND